MPSKEILIVCTLFYILGIVFVFMNPDLARLTFPGGMFLDNIEAKIRLPSSITLDYFFNQFFYYLGAISFNIFLNNLFLIGLCIFSGIAIFPVILIGLFMKMGVTTFFLVEKLGFTGFIVLLGSFHLYFEFLAALLAIDAFFKFYISFINAVKDKKIEIFKNNIINDFLPLVLRIILLLAIAAILEVFWSTWWVYIFTNHYVSWYEFYFGAYSVILK
ncbi:MAG TPA: stage II sporulation protein M [Methanobacterium sp.]|nr:stage II sporulation protein M [Methanobacterium sp.]